MHLEGTNLESWSCTHGGFLVIGLSLKRLIWNKFFGAFKGRRCWRNPESKEEPIVFVNSPTMRAHFSHSSPEQNRLSECEEQAKAAKKGMWSDGNGSHTIRDLKYTIENPRHFVDSHHQKPVNGESGGQRQMWLRVISFCLLSSSLRFIKSILLI